MTPAAAGVPIPARLTSCGLPEALSATRTEPCRSPVTDGVKVTLIWQLEFAAKVLGLMGQVFVWPKSPVVEILLMVKAPLPVFCTVTV